MKQNQAQHSMVDDAELVHASRQGDKRAFVEIVARHQAMVCGIALGVLRDFGASEDAAQEAFLKAWKNIRELRDPGRLRSWLGQIAHNTALAQLRRTKVHAPLDQTAARSDDAPTPDEAVASREEMALVRDSLDALPELYRLPLILFYREGRSIRAVADALEISEDAVKQRLARGRAMLRDRMAGLIETVLVQTRPSAVFTVTIAAAIGASMAPAVLAGGVFASASAAGSTITSTTSILTVMSKPLFVTTALVAVVCVPIGFHVRSGPTPTQVTALSVAPEPVIERPAEVRKPSYEESRLFTEWRQLHDEHGTTAEAMPVLYKAILDIADPVRRRSFRAALIAEWVQVDPDGGLVFFLKQEPGQARQFFEEWLELDPQTAVDRLLAAGPGWEKVARRSLVEIAERVPWRVATIASRLPEPESYWDTQVRDAFALIAGTDLNSSRESAEGLTGPNRDQALAGVAQTWAKRNINEAVEWARALPKEVDRDEVIRAALVGRASVDPVGALDLVGLHRERLSTGSPRWHRASRGPEPPRPSLRCGPTRTPLARRIGWR